MSNNVTNLDPLTTLNASSSVYQTSKINQRNQQLKAEELTLLIQKLLSVGTFESIGEAVQAGIKRGTFVVIDNPNTPKREFRVVLIN